MPDSEKPKTHTVYDLMAFPPHEHREYPKHLHPEGPGGRVVVVRDAEEELAFMLEQETAAGPEAAAASEPPMPKPPERKTLHLPETRR